VPTIRDPRLAREQAYLDVLYARLDEVRDVTRAQLRQVLLEAGTGTPQSVVERDAFATTHADRLSRLDAAEGRLCFGAMDRAEGPRTYIGRIGLTDEEQEPILVDWRAPVATAFYQATIADPRGLVRRRHLRTKGREVTGLADDVLGVAAGEGSAEPGESDETGETGDTMLLEALSAPRTGRMGDIIATLQAEQDRIIRADSRSVLVVDGGPGTGKTAVALHRAAYLLYTERRRLDRSGVLVVGPSPVFLRYIDQVLPSLGETGVVFATPARLFPDVDATGVEPVQVAALKGDARLADVVAAAVRDRQRLPRRTVEIVHDDDRTLRLDRDTVARARTRARRSRRPHNSARRVFVRELIGELTTQVVGQIPGGLLDEDERADVAAGLRADPAVRRLLDDLWPRLTPQRLIGDLLADPAVLARAAGRTLRPAELASLRRSPARWDGAWTPADVPLLDEAAELLGDPDEESREAAAEAAERALAAERHYAEGVLEMLGLTDQLDADTLAERWRGPERRRSAAEHAAADRDWAFGHLIVDEAQEVTPMLWRLLWRRCPGRSATLVGDLAQAARPDAPSSWREILAPHVGGRYRVERLTVNYRTPQEIMDVAADVLAVAQPGAVAPVSVRLVGMPPSAVRVPAGDALADTVVATALRLSDEIGEGQVAVLCQPASVPGLRAALPPDARIAVLSVADSKGLEFDAVLLVEPAELLDGPTRGFADLYVALTRATRMLAVVHSGELPGVLRRLG
jgi:DNA helicase IV